MNALMIETSPSETFLLGEGSPTSFGSKQIQPNRIMAVSSACGSGGSYVLAFVISILDL